MKALRMCVLICVLVQSTMSSAAFANAAGGSSKAMEQRVVVDTSARFAETRQEILADMDKGGRYEFLKPDDRRKVESELAAMAVILDKNGSVAAMNETDRVRLFNAQEDVNALLTRNDSNRLICERQAPLGTIIPVTTCRTLGDIERQKRDSAALLQNSVEKHQDVHPCLGSHCGN